MTDTVFEAGKTYLTRDGRKARVYAVDGVKPCSIHGAFLWDEEWESCRWLPNGQIQRHRANDPDLMPPKQAVYANIQPGGSGGVHPNREEADEEAGTARIACIRIEYEEGQYDD